jgi:hypothetical protein
MAAKTAGTWAAVDTAGVGGFTDIDSTARFALGFRVKVKDTSATTDYGYGELIYLQGCASTTRGCLATINDNWLTALTVARATGAVGVALAATVASTYGWYQILGRGVATSNTTIVDGTQAYACGTAGMIDDAPVAGDAISGMIISSTTDTGTCIVTMTTYPVMADFDNA